MASEEVGAFLDTARAQWVRDLVSGAGFDEEAARAKADADFAAWLPDGAATTGQFPFVVEDATGARVGTVWLVERRRAGRPFGHLLDIRIDPGVRHRGYGRAAMRLLEAEALRRGYDGIELNVFGGNEVARALYGTEGYHETFVTMRKPLTARSEDLDA
jgi:ribosomal protein S18 acetylase RimI-like enzyme